MKKLLIILTVLGVLVGCGPVYSTSYKFIPPKTAKANKCINRCQSIKKNCESNCSQERRMCHIGNTMLVGITSATRHRAHHMRGGVLHRTGNNCNFDCGCNASYRECYASCGGEVVEIKRCTAFCGD